MALPALSERVQELFPSAREEVLHEAALAHPAIFLDVFGMLNDPIKGPIPFRLWDWQWELLAHLMGHKRVIILKARQLGVSWLLAGYALWVARTKPGSHVLLVSRKESVAGDVLAKSSFLYHALPKGLKVAHRRGDKDNGTELAFGMLGSNIQAVASTRESGRSESSTLVIPDEWAFHPEDAAMYNSYAQTIGTEGQIVGCSTANGRRGLFYNLFTAARRGENSFLPIFLPWTLRPDYTRAFYEMKKREFESTGEPWALQQEFPETEQEAFGGSLRTFFAREHIERLAGAVGPPLRVVGYDSSGGEVPVAGGLHKGSLRVWQEPRYATRYVVGADVADAMSAGSRSVAVVVEARTLRHVATLAGYWEPYTYAQLLLGVARHYHDALLAPERNNHGVSVVDALHRVWQYPNLYRTRSKWSKESRLGWTTSTETRSIMFDALRMAVADGSWFTQDEEWIEEASTFEADENGGRPRAAHGARDDGMVAAAIAVQVREQYPAVRRSYTTQPLSR